MIITESFVFLNYPKTGSTFVRRTLKELYSRKTRWFPPRRRRRLETFNAPNLRVAGGDRLGKPNPHGAYWQIPESAGNLPVYSVFRDPVRRVVSAYHYADWKKEVAFLDDPAAIRSRYPGFPELDLTGYLEYTKEFSPLKLVVGPEEFGPWAASFVHFFLKDSHEAAKADLNFPGFDALKRAMGTVRFLNNENLNEELAEMLLHHGFSKGEVAFIRTKEKVNESAASSNPREADELDTAGNFLRDEAALIRRLAFA